MSGVITTISLGTQSAGLHQTLPAGYPVIPQSRALGCDSNESELKCPNPSIRNGGTGV